MYIANDKNKNRTHILDVVEKEKYYCPICNEELVIKNKGTINAHHFAHKSNSICQTKDGWHYDMTEWHYQWQSQFPLENQEIVFQKDNKIHRADIFINNTIIEFQHSPIEEVEFYDRNDFYNDLGYKVIWIFDVQDKEVEFIDYSSKNHKSVFSWKYPIRFLNDFNYNNKMVEVYLQNGRNTWNINPNYKSIEYKEEIEEIEEFNILKLDWISPSGLKRFITNEEISDVEFLNLFFELKYKDKDNEEVKEYTIHDIADSISVDNPEIGNSFYGYCPLSKNELTNHNNCIDCNYLDTHSFRCMKRFEKIHSLNINKVNNIEYDEEGKVKEFDIIADNKNIKYKGNKDFPSYKKTILEFVNLNKNMKVARFTNIEKGTVYQMSASNMKLLRQENKCYGKYCGKEAGLKAFDNETEIFYWNKKIWLLTWYKEF